MHKFMCPLPEIFLFGCSQSWLISACLSKLSPLKSSFLPWPTCVKWYDYPLSPPPQLLYTIQLISHANSLQPELVFVYLLFLSPISRIWTPHGRNLTCLVHHHCCLESTWYTAGIQHNFVYEWMNEWLWLVNAFIFKGVGYAACYIPSKFESVQILKS